MSLNRRPVGNGFVGIGGQIGGCAGQVGEHRTDHRHPCRATGEENPIELVPSQAGVLEHQFRDVAGPGEQTGANAVELVPSHWNGRAETVGRQRDPGAIGIAEAVLRDFGTLAQVCLGEVVLQEVLASGSDEPLVQQLDQGVVEIEAAQVAVAVGGQDPKVPAGDLQHRDVERAAAQVVHQQPPVHPLGDTVGERGGGGFVQYAQYVQARDPSSVDGCSPWCVVEVCGHGDHCVGDSGAQGPFGVFLHSLEDEGRDLLGPPPDPSVCLESPGRVAHRTLHELHHVQRRGHHRAFGHGADERLRSVEQHDRGRDVLPLAIE